MKTKNGLLTVSLAMSLLAAQPAFSVSDGGATSGGGSGIAAEIQRATNEFIRMVEVNPGKFPGIDPQILKTIDPEIRVTGKPIDFCDQGGSLEAYSDLGKVQTTFHLGSWAKKSWLEKVLLAGHERLVLAQYEKSNRYPFSNKVYEIDRENQEKNTGPIKGICELGERSCEFAKDAEAGIGMIISGFGAGDLTQSEGKSLLDDEQTVIEMHLVLLAGLKKIEIQRRWINFGDPQVEVVKYEQQVRLAYENHFRPLLLEAKRMIDESAPEPKCVDLSGSSASAVANGAN